METNNLRRQLETEFFEGKNSDVEEDDESVNDEEDRLVSFLGYNNDGSTYTTDELENNSYIDDENFSMMMLVKKDEGFWENDVVSK